MKTKRKEDTVVELLFVIRAATAKHMTYLLHPELVPDEFPASKFNQKAPGAQTNLYPILRKLQKKKLITKVYDSNVGSDLFHLTQEGLERAYELLDIVEGHVGKGYKGDYGYFPYDNAHIPPLKQINHFITIVEFIIKMKALTSRYGIEFDYCDNRYSVIKYVDQQDGKEVAFDLKPDLLIFLKGRCIAIEVDLKTERGQALDSKFHRYKKYFEYYEKNKTLPFFKEVWFVTRDETSKRRWFSVCESFIDQLDVFNNHLNLVYLSLYQINDYLTKRFLPEIKLVKYKVQPYLLKEKNSSKTLSGMEYFELNGLENANVLYTNFVNNTILVCIPARAFETRFIWKVIEVHKYFRSKDINSRLYFVLCYVGERPKIPVFHNCCDKAEFQEACKNVILADVQDAPKFFDKEGKALLDSNPIQAWIKRTLQQ